MAKNSYLQRFLKKSKLKNGVKHAQKRSAQMAQERERRNKHKGKTKMKQLNAKKTR